MAPSQEQSYQRLIDALDAAEWRDDPRFRTNDLRVANRAAMKAAIEARLMTGTSENWIERLNAAGVPCGRVKSLSRSVCRPADRGAGDGDQRRSIPAMARSGCSASRSNSHRLPANCGVLRPTSAADSDAVLREIRLFGRGHRPTTRRRRGLKHSRSARDGRHRPARPARRNPRARRDLVSRPQTAPDRIALLAIGYRLCR